MHHALTRLLKTAVLMFSLCSAALALAAVDINTASVVELDGLKGIGPAMSRKILDERQKGAFKDWHDLMQRVKGIRAHTAAQYSAQGLTVNGTTFPPTTTTP